MACIGWASACVRAATQVRSRRPHVHNPLQLSEMTGHPPPVPARSGCAALNSPTSFSTRGPTTTRRSMACTGQEHVGMSGAMHTVCNPTSHIRHGIVPVHVQAGSAGSCHTPSFSP